MSVFFPYDFPEPCCKAGFLSIRHLAANSVCLCVWRLGLGEGQRTGSAEFFLTHIIFTSDYRHSRDLAKPTLRTYKNEVSTQDKASNYTFNPCKNLNGFRSATGRTSARVSVCVYAALWERKGTYFHPWPEKTEAGGGWQIDPCIKGGAGKRVESQYPQKLPFLSSCLLPGFIRCLSRVLTPCFVFRFHPYTAESILYNFLLWLNPWDTAYKFKEFQASTETPTPTPRT